MPYLRTAMGIMDYMVNGTGMEWNIVLPATVQAINSSSQLQHKAYWATVVLRLYLFFSSLINKVPLDESINLYDIDFSYNQ